MSLKMWRVTVKRTGLVLAETAEDALSWIDEISWDSEASEEAEEVSRSWKPRRNAVVWHDLPGEVSEELADKLCRAGVTQAEAHEAMTMPVLTRSYLSELADRRLREREVQAELDAKAQGTLKE